MNRRAPRKTAMLMAGVLVFLFLLQFILPAYHHSTFSKIMVLASYAVGFNILLGYTGLMSLGHAMFFSTGMYVTGICVYHFGFTGIPALGIGLVITVFVSMLIGAVALRTSGVSFLIVTLMFGQTAFPIGSLLRPIHPGAGRVHTHQRTSTPGSWKYLLFLHRSKFQIQCGMAAFRRLPDSEQPADPLTDRKSFDCHPGK